MLLEPESHACSCTPHHPSALWLWHLQPLVWVVLTQGTSLLLSGLNFCTWHQPRGHGSHRGPPSHLAHGLFLASPHELEPQSFC